MERVTRTQMEALGRTGWRMTLKEGGPGSRDLPVSWETVWSALAYDGRVNVAEKMLEVPLGGTLEVDRAFYKRFR